MNRALKCAALCAALATAAIPASATMQLRVSDGTPAGTIIIIDQGIDDADPTLGVVSYSGPVGSQWLITVNTGVTKPVLGSAAQPDIDLNSYDISSESGGVLTVELTETEYTGSGPATANIGGNTAGSVNVRTFVDYANTPFGKGTLIASQGPFTGGVFSGATPGVISATSPYAITIELQITHAASGRTGLDAHFFVTPPSYECPPDTTVRCGGSLDPDVNPALGKPAYTGAPECLPASITYADVANVISACNKIITRTWTIADACGVTNYCTQTITVFEDVAPVLTVPANTTVECNAIPLVGSATGSDACDTNVIVEYLGETRVDGQNPACSYSLVRTWKATDSCNNAVTNSQTILVRDTTAPVLTVPANLTVECSAVPAVGNASATDICDANPVVTYLGATTNASGCGSVITRTWKAADACGNAVTNSQVITVRDITAPVLTVPANATVECSAIPAPGNASATDNCSANPVVTYLGAITNGSGCNYTITRRWKAADTCGNAVTNSQILTVRDTTAPVINSVPTGGEIGCVALPSDATIKSQVTASDNCGTVTINVTHVDSGTACSTNRVFTITATDGCNTSPARTVSYTATCGGGQVCSTLNLEGSSSLSGTAGNIRTFTINGVSVKASAFSRVKGTGGAWSTAFLGQYGGGLGVTDGSEGDGSGNSHTMDNIDRDNYVLFEFSQPVVLNSASLGYVVSDSDITAWIGTFADPFNNHLNLSDAVLGGFGFTEDNLTDIVGTRTVDLNAGEVSGNAIILAAWPGDVTPEDQVKIRLLEFCTRGVCVTNPPATGSICGSVLRDCDRNGSLTGESGLGGWTVTLKNSATSAVIATKTTDASGNYCFTNIAAGNYCVVVTPMASYAQTVDPDSTLDNKNCFALTAGQNKSGVNFGYSGTAPSVFIKMTGPATAKCGDTITYTFCVTNTGNTCVYGGLEVQDPLLGGQVFHQTPVSPGQGFCFTKTYVIPASYSGTLVNTATAIGHPPGAADVTMAVSVSTTVTCTPVAQGCTLTIGYYKNHPSDIAPLPINLGTAGGAKTLVVSSSAIGVNVLGQHTYGAPANGITKLYAQLLAAKLNGLRGASLTAAASAISAADAFLATRNHLDWGSLTATEKSNVAAWHTTLDKYNNGLIGPGHCGDQECNRALDLNCTPGNKSVKLVWNKSTEATSYKVLRGLNPNGPYTTIKTGHTTTNYTDTAVTNGVAYYYVIAACKNGAAFTDSDEVCATPAVAPVSPWKTTDIGTPGYPGAASLASGVFTILGGGDDIWNTADKFRYTYQSGSGDGTVIARVTAVGNTDAWAKAGVMIRESLTPGSKHAFMCLTPGNGAAFQSRNATGGSSLNVNTTGLLAPYWVKVTRVGNVFTGFASANGTTWTQIGQQAITMTTGVYIGLAVTSHNDATLTTATFQNVTATP